MDAAIHLGHALCISHAFCGTPKARQQGGTGTAASSRNMSAKSCGTEAFQLLAATSSMLLPFTWNPTL
eukprot:1152272-Pelagomonas_calceolata.AAC.12